MKDTNLFKYATSELSQDAFICWLMSHAMKGNEDKDGITLCARDFLKNFIPDSPGDEFLYVTKIQRQYNHIDVLITVNDKYLVILEDKTFTSEHDNQLVVYYDFVVKENPTKRVYGVYFKIGFQSDLSNVKESHYLPISRDMIDRIMGRYAKNISNPIFQDFYQYIHEYNELALSYRTTRISEWGSAQIQQFYDDLKTDFSQWSNMHIDYGYVANRSGGFYGLWFSNMTYIMVDGAKYELYVQLEFSDGNMDICYKVSSKKKGERLTKTIRDQFIWVQIDEEWTNVAQKYNFIKPSRYGAGNTVTLGIYNSSFDNYVDAIKTIKAAINDFSNLSKTLIK